MCLIHMSTLIFWEDSCLASFGRQRSVWAELPFQAQLVCAVASNSRAELSWSDTLLWSERCISSGTFCRVCMGVSRVPLGVVELIGDEVRRITQLSPCLRFSARTRVGLC